MNDAHDLDAKASWLRLLYDLVSWVDPRWLARFDIDAAWPPRLVNHMLVSALGLDSAPPCSSWPSGLAELERVWYAVPDIGRLMGARCLRDSILASNGLRQIHPLVPGFLPLPIVLPPVIPAASAAPSPSLSARVASGGEGGDGRASLDAAVQRWGLACLRGAFSHAPACIRERLCLHFAPDSEPLPAQAFPLSERTCRALFQFACAYYDVHHDAKTYHTADRTATA
jgi:hypothetical protein